MPLPYHRRPKCPQCGKRRAAENVATGAYTEPCVTCVVAEAFTLAKVCVRRVGSIVYASADNVPEVPVAYVVNKN